MTNCTTSVVIKAITRAKSTNYFSMLYVIHLVSYFISHNNLRYKEKSSPIFQMSPTGHIPKGGRLYPVSSRAGLKQGTKIKALPLSFCMTCILTVNGFYSF